MDNNSAAQLADKTTCAYWKDKWKGMFGVEIVDAALSAFGVEVGRVILAKSHDSLYPGKINVLHVPERGIILTEVEKIDCGAGPRCYRIGVLGTEWHRAVVPPFPFTVLGYIVSLDPYIK